MNEIYTYTGNILIPVNPFQSFPHLYNSDVMEKYKGATLGEQMIKEGIGQTILVSGESGAGKTESTKMLMCYLAYMGDSVAAEGRTMEQKVLQSSPVLEAFGNAKTVRNNNSSRFGKIVEIQFNSRGRISGDAIRPYLLERSRVDFDANGDAAKDESEKIDSLVEKLIQFETVHSWTPTVPSMYMASQAMSSRLFPESVVADELVKSECPSIEYHCNSCSTDCSRKRYHCQKQVS